MWEVNAVVPEMLHNHSLHLYVNLNQNRRWELYTSMSKVIAFESQSVSIVILLEPLKYIFKTAYRVLL